MTAVAQGATSTAAVPLLSLWTSDGKLLDDPDTGSLSFTIVDVSTDAKEADPVTRVTHTVNLTDDRLGSSTTPHFAAVFELDADEPTGAHEIRWTWEMSDVPQTYVQRFDVLAGVPRGLGGGYGLVSDFRAEGFTKNDVSDIRLLKLITEQSAFIEKVTHRFFEPRHLDVRADGTDSHTLLLGQPIIALDLVKVHDTILDIDPANRNLLIYNRHLAGLLDPDDRIVPCVQIPELIEYQGYDVGAYQDYYQLTEAGRFYKSPQNVTVSGLFGYTDQDGGPIGQTPAGVQRLLRLLVMRNIPKAACTEESLRARYANRLTSMRTRDQAITFAGNGLIGSFTGDLEIDTLFATYSRPIGIASP